MKHPTIRSLREQDFIDLYGEAPTVSVRGYAAELDGECIGIAGVSMKYPAEAFSLLDPRMKAFPRAIVEAVRLYRQLLSTITVPVYALADQDEPSAPIFLRHVGFEQLDEVAYKWPS